MTSLFLPVEHLRWLGQPVQRAALNLTGAIHALPTFSRSAFGEGNNTNPGFDVITRNTWHEDPREVPVAVVSRQYELLQHPAILRDVAIALRHAGVALCGESAGSIAITPLGERMEARFPFRNLSFDPGDGHPLHLQLLVRNSVDGSCALEISVRWLRQICSNGMCVLTREDRLREVHHRDRFDVERISEFLATRTAHAIRQQKQMRDWAGMRTESLALHEWISKDVRETWGPYAAVRMRHICNTGFDGEPDVLPGKRLQELDDIGLRNPRAVPGSRVPAKSLYAVYQALTWIADHRSNLEDRETWGADALALLQKLDPELPLRTAA